MRETFNERMAFRMQLESLLKLRHELRSDYVDRDKALSLEIKEIISKVQAIEHKLEVTNSLTIELDESQTEEVKIEERPNQESEPVPLPVKMKVRREHTRINYEEIKEKLQILLQETHEPMSLSSIVSELEQRYGIHLSNPYITIKKVTKEMSEVQEAKEGRVLLFAWKND